MTKRLLVLTGSARPSSASDKLLPLIASAVQAQPELQLDIARVDELNLPFYNAPTPPSAEEYEITDSAVRAWSERVTGADAVIWLMPEYNHAMTAIQKNALDWLYSEWHNKPLGIVAYGFYGGKHALENAKQVMDVIKPDLRKTVGLALMQELESDGTPKDEAAVTASIADVIQAVAA